MDKEQIKKILPHRDDMLLLDEVYLEDGVAKGHYTVKGNEFFLNGHFPNNPIVPGVILCEIAAQTACVLFSENLLGKTPYYTGINNVKFRRKVKPGDTIETTISIKKSKPPFYFTKGEAKVKGETCLSGEFSFVIS